jgi:hypothetical protein
MRPLLLDQQVNIMCDPATIGLIVSAVGTGAQAIDQGSALRKRDQEVSAGIARQSALQREAGSRVNKTIQDVTKSNPDEARQAAQKDFMTALQKAKLTQGGAGLVTPAGAVSGRFATDVGSARTAAGTEATDLAGNLATIDAPTFQRLKEGQDVASTASDLGLIAGRSQGEDFLAQLRASQQRPNPWIQGAGQGLTAFGSALATKAPRVKPGTGTPIPLSPGGNYSYAIPGG